MRRADQQPSQQAVAAFADAQLLVRAAALVAPRTQPQIRADVATAAKPLRVADLEHEAQRGERAHAGDLLQSLGDRILPSLRWTNCFPDVLISAVSCASTASTGHHG